MFLQHTPVNNKCIKEGCQRHQPPRGAESGEEEAAGAEATEGEEAEVAEATRVLAAPGEEAEASATDTPNHTSHRGSHGFQFQLLFFYVFFPPTAAVLLDKKDDSLQHCAIFVPHGEKYISLQCYIQYASIISKKCYVSCFVPYGENFRESTMEISSYSIFKNRRLS